MPPHLTFCMRCALLEKHGLCDTSFQIAADFDAMLRWLCKHKLRSAHTPEVIVRMRVGGESNLSVSRTEQKSHEDLRALRRNGVGGKPALSRKNPGSVKQFRPKK